MTQNSPLTSEELERVDMQAIALLTSLAEQHGNDLGPTMNAALLHAARRLWEFWNEEEDDDEPDPDDGPCGLGAGEVPLPESPHPAPGEETAEIMFR